MFHNNAIIKAGMVFSLLITAAAGYGQDIPDHSIKKNIEAINDPLHKITQLDPKQFEYNAGSFKHLRLKAGKQYGFIAEDIQAVFPHLVNEKPVSYRYGKNVYRNATIKTIDETGLIPVLVASIKEQQHEIEKLKSEMLELKRQMAFKE
ncbi:tail fiber domain-containing protein [Agriterribacter sp.]|uniref:tail fiber domain-containing protein n=1 Tax=Agriterribacter sp. TaxID=2821509 RepID=UPI002B94F328|nr:tail fiber domain-containing protein [Agriterribacter sp.]HRO45797.1 tail fiber domain-containing protein [Agriterribacter sp.]HRQ16748.1 tail fiber domain-containing protein [Agriterribacter sp.]